jgi:hypothetical protein
VGAGGGTLHRTPLEAVVAATVATTPALTALGLGAGPISTYGGGGGGGSGGGGGVSGNVALAQAFQTRMAALSSVAASLLGKREALSHQVRHLA